MFGMIRMSSQFSTVHPAEKRDLVPHADRDPGFRRDARIRKRGLALLFSGAALGLLACQQADVKPVEAPEVETQEVEVVERATLPLPAFPDYSAPLTELAEDQSGVIHFPIKSPYDFSRVLNGYAELPTHSGLGTLVLPEGASEENPVPAMVILHGSGGIKEGREMTYAELFAQNGIAGFVVDYYAPRGVTEATPYVMKTMAATEVDVISDAYAALNILATHPAIDGARIGVTGYSYGGMGTRYTLDARIKDIMAPDVAPFALHMDIYGPCHQNTGSWTTTGAPYLAIYGDKDNSVEPEACSVVQDKLRAGGSSVEAHIIEGAGHAWENASPLGEFGGAYIRGCEFSFDPETGGFLVDGKAGFQPEPDMSRAERAAVRAGLGGLVGGCVGQGYTVGSNPEADTESKALQLAFMKRVFGL